MKGVRVRTGSAVVLHSKDGQYQQYWGTSSLVPAVHPARHGLPSAILGTLRLHHSSRVRMRFPVTIFGDFQLTNLAVTLRHLQTTKRVLCFVLHAFMCPIVGRVQSEVFETTYEICTGVLLFTNWLRQCLLKQVCCCTVFKFNIFRYYTRILLTQLQSS